jgi:hypothetical protein
MSATSSNRSPAVKTCMPYPAGKATPLAVTVNDLSVLVISRRLHDEKCRDRDACWNRDWHALDCFETTVRKTPRRPGGRPGRTGNLRSRYVSIIHCLSG